MGYGLWWGSATLGHAIARYQGFTNCGFHIVLVFDNDPEKIGKQVGWVHRLGAG